MVAVTALPLPCPPPSPTWRNFRGAKSNQRIGIGFRFHFDFARLILAYVYVLGIGRRNQNHFVNDALHSTLTLFTPPFSLLKPSWLELSLYLVCPWGARAPPSLHSSPAMREEPPMLLACLMAYGLLVTSTRSRLPCALLTHSLPEVAFRRKRTMRTFLFLHSRKVCVWVYLLKIKIQQV